jgi:AAA family ATP:ADP antiporter
MILKAHDTLHKTLRRAVDVEPGEVGALLLGFAYFFCLLSGYYLLRPLRDAFGLAGGKDELQWLFTATFFVMLPLVPVFCWLVRSLPPQKFVPIVYRFFIANILIFSVLIASGVKEVHVARVFFVWTSVYNLFVVSIFWSVLADCFSSAQGKRLFGFIAAGGTAGAFVGPALAASMIKALGPVALTLASALLLEIALQCCKRLLKSRVAIAAAEERNGVNGGDREIGGGILAGATLMLRSPYLMGIVIYIFLHTSAATFLYFEQGRIVAEQLKTTAERTAYFAQVDMAVSILTLALQFFITGKLLRRFGVTFALFMLPLAAAISFASLSIWPNLLCLAIVQSARRAADYAFSRPGREVLFTVLDREAKYKAKNFIETVVYRGGDALSGWFSTGLTALGLGFGAITLLLSPLLAFWAWLSVRLGRQQEELAKGGRHD